jgi:S-adenosylmethionine:tRNA ribosyltransferase-isomerase
MTSATHFAADGATPADGGLVAAQFDYMLPEGAIAQHPVEPRSAARLLVDLEPEAVGGPVHDTVAGLPAHLREGDVLVVNETKVLPARLSLRKPTGGAAEVFLLEQPDPARLDR